jgi:hypothetical protein
MDLIGMALHVNEFFDKDQKGDLKRNSIGSICFDNVFFGVFLAIPTKPLFLVIGA